VTEKGSGKTLVFSVEESSETLRTLGSQNKYADAIGDIYWVIY
jgi:hypothetical protein